MMSLRHILPVFMLATAATTMQAETYKIRFDSNKTKSGAKIALKDLNSKLPTD